MLGSSRAVVDMDGWWPLQPLTGDVVAGEMSGSLSSLLQTVSSVFQLPYKEINRRLAELQPNGGLFPYMGNKTVCSPSATVSSMITTIKQIIPIV